MTEFLVRINADSAAFDEAPETELANILRDLAMAIELGVVPPLVLHDSNGNSVGTFAVARESGEK